MKWIILTLILAITTVAKADDDPKTLLIYASSTPPRGVTKTEWNSTILEACNKWHSGPGLSITIIDDINKAEIMVMTKPLTHLKVYARCAKPWDWSFPHSIDHNAKVRIEVNPDIRRLKHNNLLRTMTHEFGHAIGLGHNPRSIVHDGWPRSQTMTTYDLEKAKEYRRHVLRLAGDSFTNL